MNENFVYDNNISSAWVKVLSNILKKPNKEALSSVVKIEFPNNRIEETIGIKRFLEEELKNYNKTSIETVASTIFPISLWNPNLERKVLFDTYKRNWPKYRMCKPNRNGTYFQRLIAFNIVDKNEALVNQLDNIIEIWNSGTRRRSALQASIFDPRIDQRNTPYGEFPCLQQVSFLPLGRNGKKGLEVVGYYATQTVFEKAYGNYLGLCRLGEFMANEMNIPFAGMTCIASVLKLQNKDIPIEYFKELENRIIA